MNSKRYFFSLFVFIFFSFYNPLCAQDIYVQETNFISYIGLSVSDIITGFGIPNSVYAVRGQEEWQDDVVFAYKNIDFYIVKDRVWQISINKAIGINLGDPKGAVLLVLGNSAQDNNTHILQTLTGFNWPLQWRFNIKAGKVSAIYLYRLDY
ncbi:MAG: hypothetical protein Ta2F_12330 [Termitinemataceae bacterium]|nr:MAG: hypothetical protein Ta2F_12330 [Termitinemataceae bacterium]